MSVLKTNITIYLASKSPKMRFKAFLLFVGAIDHRKAKIIQNHIIIINVLY